MQKNIKYLKYWGFNYLNSKYWNRASWRSCYFLNLNLNVSGECEILGYPALLLCLTQKRQNNKKLKNLFLSKYQQKTFFFYLLFLINFNRAIKLKKLTKTYETVQTETFYFNNNFSFLDFSLKINLTLSLKKKNKKQQQDFFVILGLPNMY